MFTGIISDIGTIRRVQAAGDTGFEIACAYDMDTVDLGASIACQGVCLTVTDKTTDSFWVSASAETLSKTVLATWAEGTRINLERALKMGDELGGHMVSGHVDGLAEVISREPSGDSVLFTIETPAELAPFIASKGSIALDGVSLTVNHVAGCECALNIIPHTLTHTTIGEQWQVGQKLHLEIDIVARYVVRYTQATKAA